MTRLSCTNNSGFRTFPWYPHTVIGTYQGAGCNRLVCVHVLVPDKCGQCGEVHTKLRLAVVLQGQLVNVVPVHAGHRRAHCTYQTEAIFQNNEFVY
jgi:hypothetical protein